MSIEKLSKRTGLPKETIKHLKENGFLTPPFKPVMPKFESKNVGPSTPASECAFFVSKCKALILDLKPDSQESYEKAEKLTYLIIARFSYDEIAKMLSEPALIPVTVKSHIERDNELRPNLCSILRGLDLSGIHNAFELGDEIEICIKLPADAKPLILEIQKKCDELKAQNKSIKAQLISSNILLIFAIIPLIGVPFALTRSSMLTDIEAQMQTAEELNASLTKLLSDFELNIDLYSLELPTYFKNNYLNYGSPASAASDFSDEISSKSEIYAERARSVNALLNRISFI